MARVPAVPDMGVLEFDQPVVVETAKLGRHLVISDVVRAAEMLINDWPSAKAGSRHLAARKACLAVLEGQRKAISARRAFQAAAEEADILVAAGIGTRPAKKIA